MRSRGSARRIVDDQGDERLARNVGYCLLEVRRDFVAGIMRGCGPSSCNGNGSQCCADDSSDLHGSSPFINVSSWLRLLDWAAQESVWVIEDDYLSELQLKGRAAPALASLDCGGRVIHIGSFSKTISPTLRLGFLVPPLSLLSRLPGVPAGPAPPPRPSL